MRLLNNHFLQTLSVWFRLLRCTWPMSSIGGCYEASWLVSISIFIYHVPWCNMGAMEMYSCELSPLCFIYLFTFLPVSFILMTFVWYFWRSWDLFSLFYGHGKSLLLPVWRYRLFVCIGKGRLSSAKIFIFSEGVYFLNGFSIVIDCDSWYLTYRKSA